MVGIAMTHEALAIAALVAVALDAQRIPELRSVVCVLPVAEVNGSMFWGMVSAGVRPRTSKRLQSGLRPSHRRFYRPARRMSVSRSARSWG